MLKFLDLKDQYLRIKKDIDKSIKQVLDESAFIGGKYVEGFERAFSNYNDLKHCIGVNNGTDALEIAIESLDLPKNSEIIVPANSFFASSEAVTRTGNKVIFCDCNEDDYTINIKDLETKITKNTSAIIPVHLYGHPCNMEEIKRISNKYNLKIIEDCAQAIGAEFNKNKVGTFGDVACFSFYPGKNLGAYGDAGCIVTNNDEIEKKCRMISNHGRLSKYDHKFEGRNSRLDGLQASILTTKLKYIDNWNKIRISLANSYLKELENFEQIILPFKQKNVKQVYHLFVIRSDRRDDLKNYLYNNKIQTGIHYPIALPDLEAYRHLKKTSNKNNAQKNSKKLLSLPIGDHLTINDVKHVSRIIKNFA